MAANYLYRLWDSNGNLLYVGISKTLVNRLTQHDALQAWAAEVANVTAIKYPSREAAREAELLAIRKERPKYNIEGRHQKRSVKESLAETAKVFETLDAADKERVLNGLQSMVTNWPSEWNRPSEVSARRSMSSIAALMKAGYGLQEAFSTVYPDSYTEGDTTNAS